MKFDWQWTAVGLLLILAVIYVFRSVKKSFSGEHDCPDCDIASDSKKVKKPGLKK
jgi:hypothetical protein